MTERCDGAGAGRVRDHSTEETACEPPVEDQEARRLQNERSGEQRRDSWIDEHDSRGGMSQRAASKISRTSPSCDGLTAGETARAASDVRSHEMHMRSAGYTKGTDKPLEDDVIGNALPGLVVGSVAAGVRAGAASVWGGSAKHLVENTVHETGRMAAALATHVGEDAVAETLVIGAEHTGHAIGERAQRDGDLVPAGNASPAPVGTDRIPYLPGQVPVRIPELPQTAVERPHVVLVG